VLPVLPEVPVVELVEPAFPPFPPAQNRTPSPPPPPPPAMARMHPLSPVGSGLGIGLTVAEPVLLQGAMVVVEHVGLATVADTQSAVAPPPPPPLDPPAPPVAYPVPPVEFTPASPMGFAAKFKPDGAVKLPLICIP
jgi:hypothetical protein